MRNILTYFKPLNLLFYSNYLFYGLNKNKLVAYPRLDVICILFYRDIYYISNCFLFKYCKLCTTFDSSMSYICTGGSLWNKIENNIYKEEEERKWLNSVRYEEQLCTPERHSSHTCKEKSASVKIMTYNVLSQTLLDKHRYLYRKASPVTLKWHYRYPRLLGEITQHDPDIICLQEVEEDHLKLFNKLEDFGFVGFYKKRTGGRIDGCAIYFKVNTFSLVHKLEVEYFRPGIWKLSRDNVGLIVRLFWLAGNRHITVANTHLLYNPKRTDVRLAQISLLISELTAITEGGKNNDLVFLTGDLNSYPTSAVIDLIKNGEITSLSASKNTFNSHLIQKHEFNFRSVHDYWSNNDLEATTFQEKWVTADYIFYSVNDTNLCLSSRLRLPVSRECKQFIKKLPNYVSPSDHLPLVATFILALD